MNSLEWHCLVIFGMPGLVLGLMVGVWIGVSAVEAGRK